MYVFLCVLIIMSLSYYELMSANFKIQSIEYCVFDLSRSVRTKRLCHIKPYIYTSYSAVSNFILDIVLLFRYLPQAP